MKPSARNAAKGEEAITGSFPGSQTRPPTYPPFPSTCVLQLDRSPAATLPLTTSIFVMAWYEAIATRPPLGQTRQLSGPLLCQSDSQDNTAFKLLPSFPLLLLSDSGTLSSLCHVVLQWRRYLPSSSLDRIPTASIRPLSCLLSNLGGCPLPLPGVLMALFHHLLM